MNKQDLFKKLLPGFLPLFVFIIADEVWGTKIGLIVAVVFGVGQLVYSYFKERKLDKFVLSDTLLIIALGGVSILLDNDVFFKLKPALIGSILVALLGYSVFGNNNLVLLMSKRYMQGIEMQKEQIDQFNNSLRVMFWMFLGHTLLTIYAAFYLSNEAWVFISGGLFYILFGVYFVIEIVRKRMQKKRFENEEWLPLVDEDGKVVGQAPRSQCHLGPGKLHPVVHMHVVNKNKMIYLQKRAVNKLVQPGKWDTAVGGHVSAGDTIEQGLEREAKEELSLEDFEARFIKKYVWESKVESELVFMFMTYYDGAIEFNTEEIEEGRYWTVKQIERAIEDDIFTPNFLEEFEVVKDYLSHKS